VAEENKIGELLVVYSPEDGLVSVDRGQGVSGSHGRLIEEVSTGRHEITVRWPDGARRTAEAVVEPGRRSVVFLNRAFRLLSRQNLAPHGSHTYMMTDRTGRTWLLWDEAMIREYDFNPNNESDLWAATTRDGIQWTTPRRLSVSSLSRDTHPVLQQDPYGVFWLVWLSQRRSGRSKTLWTSKSIDGVQWEFPRKVDFPAKAQPHLAAWRREADPWFAFAINHYPKHWLLIRGKLYQSLDGLQWKAMKRVSLTDKDGPDDADQRRYHLTTDANGDLVLAGHFSSAERARCGASLFRRHWVDNSWETLGLLSRPNESVKDGGASAPRTDGHIFTVNSSGHLVVREFDGSQPVTAPIRVQDFAQARPFHPSIAIQAGGRIVVAFGSQEGVVALCLQLE
jgi:hypothetical protein